MTQLSIYRNNARPQGVTISNGKWRDFFRLYAKGGPTEWGSTEWIRSPLSRKIIREELALGDLFLCWQTDEKAAIGLARLTQLKRRGEWTDLILERLIEFPAPVRLRELANQNASLRKVGFIATHSQGTLARATSGEADTLLRACGVDLKTLGVLAVIDGSQRVGAGFGSAENNARVEAAGMTTVREELEGSGWEVHDVSKCRGIGYDLEASQGRKQEHIEVKAVSGSAKAFILTEGELQASTKDGRWKLAVVTKALSKPTVTWYRRSDLKHLEIRPIAHTVHDRRHP